MDYRTKRNFVKDERVTVTVERILPFGVFVRLEDGREGYIRRRELSPAGDVDPQEVVSPGQQIEAVILELEAPSRSMELSHRATLPDPWQEFTGKFRQGDMVRAKIKDLVSAGAFAQILPGVDGFIPLAELALWKVEGSKEIVWVGDDVEAVITYLNPKRRKVRLSIRQRLEQLSQVEAIMECLRQKAEAEDQVESSLEEIDSTPEEGDLGREELQLDEMAQVGRTLVVEDDDAVRLPLIKWLCRQGCPAEGAKTAVKAMEKFQQQTYGLALVDLVLPGVDGLALIRQLRANRSTTPVAVMSIPEWIRERFGEIRKLGVVGVFVKPLDLEEIQWFLIRLARGETLMPLEESPVAAAASLEQRPFQKLARVMRSGLPLAGRLQSGLEYLHELTRADVGIIFHLDPVSQEVSIVAQAGQAAFNPTAVYSLLDSPVKDVIREGRVTWENHVSLEVSGRFSKLLDLLPFESCIGVPIEAGGETHHALFLFHGSPEVFSRYRVRDALAMATLFAVALESQALDERVQTVSKILLSGQLGAGFSHEVYNKISGLEIQLRNLRADHERLAGQEALRPAKSFDFAEVGWAIDRLLDVALDLKRTVGVFQELIRAEQEEEIDVNEVVRHAELLLRPTAHQHRVRIEMDLAPSLPLVVGSTDRLQRIFSNVLLNAIQHTARKIERLPSSSGTLRVTTRWESGNGRQPIQVRFTDNGPGIHRQLWDRIFALGFSTKPGGTGLGLFIARSLVESMGGRIAVEESLVPLGTTFLVELPTTGDGIREA